MTSLLQKVETGVEAGVEATEAEVKKLWNAAVTEAVSVYTNDVKPIITATINYIEANGAADLTQIARNVMKAAWDDLTGSGNLLEDLSALAGTVYDEARSAGVAIEQGAALLVTSMAHAELVTAVAPAAQTPPPAPDAETGTGTN